MADTNIKFLSQAGLSKFWELIKGKFAAGFSTPVVDANNITLGLVDANGAKIGSDVVLSAAGDGKAGIMSAAQAAQLANLEQSLVAAAPLQAVKIAGTKVNTDSDKAADLVIALEKVDGVDSIVLKDANGTAKSYFSVSDFVLNGIVNDSEVKMENGKPMLYLTFDLVGGGTKVEIIDLSKLVDIYTGANGITVDNQNVISVKVAGSYLTATTEGLGVADALWTEVARLDTLTLDAAKADATSKANAAQSAAEATAAADATTKADAARDAAIAAASTDATKKADAAQAAAEATAAGDATAKANQALADAKSYTDQEIAKIDGEGGLLADAITTAKAYTDTEVASAEGRVNAKIGAVPEGKNIVDIIAENEKVTSEALNDLNKAVTETLPGTISALDARVVATETAVGTTLPNAITKAKEDAIAAAASDATTKANDAKDAAIAAAAADATTKAGQALTDAKTYTNEEIGKVNDKIAGLDASFVEDGSKLFMTGLTQVDGQVTAVERRNLVLSDISDFEALSDADIIAIVG